MILFCDTSALVKLYIKEDFSAAMKTLASSASAIAVCRITWAEAMTALDTMAKRYWGTRYSSISGENEVMNMTKVTNTKGN